MENNKVTAEKVQVSRNGPYIVSGMVPVAEQTIVCDSDGTSVGWRSGKQYPLQEKCALCRCGHSRNKPFCDSSHYPEAETIEKTHGDRAKAGESSRV